MLRERLAAIVAVTDLVCEQHLNEEYAGLCRTARRSSRPDMPLNGIPVDARTLPDEIQAEARRLGLIPDLDRRKGSVSGTVSSGELDALINELTVDCYNDEEQLVGLLTGAEDALAVGEIATVAGAEIRIVSVDCPSDSRRGLTAMCEREGQRFELSLADIRFGDASELGRVAAAYRRWLGCDPHPAPGGAGHRQVGHP